MSAQNKGTKIRAKTRADEWVVKLGLVESRTKAQALIMAGQVLMKRKDQPNADWVAVSKSGQVFDETQVELKLADGATTSDVGRGAQKLRGALSAWPQVNASGKRCLDVGSSTGGFTQVLIESGAASVVALDVGTNQLHEKLRSHPKVIVMEQTHVLRVEESDFKRVGAVPPFEIIVTDLSFISLTKIIPTVEKWLAPGGSWIVLIKPQFEVGPKKAPGGIVKDPAFHQEAIDLIRDVVKMVPSLRWMGIEVSPIRGGDGNVEFLLWLKKEGT